MFTAETKFLQGRGRQGGAVRPSPTRRVLCPLPCAFVHGGEANEARAIVIALANEDPSGIVDYKGSWSEVTPGDGAIEGCRFCRQRQYGPVEDWTHRDSCLWVRARRAIGAPDVKL